MVKKLVCLLYVGLLFIPTSIYAYRTVLTHTVVSINTSSTVALAANLGRNYLFLQNTGSNIITCKFGAAADTPFDGINIPATTGTHLFDSAVPTAALNCRAVSAATPLTIVEGAQ